MATEAKDSSFQTGTTPNPIASNTQDFSGSDDEILDNFAAGPQPGDPPPMGDTHDDGTPMGLGGEKGKQSEPASSTLEADMVTPSGEDVPPDDTATPDPVQEAGEKGSEDVPEPEEPDTPEFSPIFLQMAGYADADAAKAAGLPTPEALAAYVRGRGELLAASRQAEEHSGQPLYTRRGQQEPKQEPPPTPEVTDGATAFQLSDEQMERLDEDLQAVIRQMNDHYQREVASLRSSLSQRESESLAEQEQLEALEFDKDVQALGEDWKDIFGEGDGHQLARSGRTNPAARLALEYRGELFQHLSDVRVDNAQRGLAPLNRKQELLYALMRQFPDKFLQASSARSSPKANVTASRPTQRKTPPKSQNEQTLAAVDAMLRKKHGYGITRRSPEDAEYDGEI